jgi:hypothetical protein
VTGGLLCKKACFVSRLITIAVQERGIFLPVL